MGTERVALARAAAPSSANAAVAALLRQHGDAVLGFCLRVLRNRADAEDVAQQVFLEAHRDYARFEGRSTARAWLFGIASHRCYDFLKTGRRRTSRIAADEDAVEAYEDPAGGPTDAVTRAQLLAALEGCLGKLSDDVRMTVLMRFQSGLSYEEMAAPLSAKADTLQTRVARALPVLRTCLEGKGWSGE